MYRLLLLFAVAMALLAPPANAVEMFTNFHNGENIGFPPLEVPIAIYGHGGWTCQSQQRPERVKSIEPVPAMTPTGFVRCDRVGKSYQEQNTSEVRQVSDVQPAKDVQYVSDRRRFWGRSSSGNGNGNSNDNNNISTNAGGSKEEISDYNSTQGPTPAKPKTGPTEGTESDKATSTNDERAKAPVSVHAHPGIAPQKNSNAAPQQPTSSRRNSDNWRAGAPPPGDSG